MSITKRNSGGTFGTGTSGSGSNIGTQVGDLVFAWITTKGGGTGFACTGFTKVGELNQSNFNTALFYKRATGTGDIPTVTWTGSSGWEMTTMALAGVIATGTPIGANASGGGAGSPVSINSVVTQRAGSAVMALGHSNGAINYTHLSSPWTTLINANSTGDAYAPYVESIIEATAGTTSPAVTMAQSASVKWNNFTVEVFDQAATEAQSSSDAHLHEQISSDIILAQHNSSDKVLHDRASSDAALSDRHLSDAHLSDAHLSDAQASDRALSDRRNSDAHLSDLILAEEISSDILLAAEHSSDKAAHDAQSSDRVASDRHLSDAQLSDRHLSDAQLSDRNLSDKVAHDAQSSDAAASSDARVLAGGQSAASDNHALQEAASSDRLAAQAISSDLAHQGEAASSDLVLQQEIASDIHNAVERASSDKLLADATSSNEQASSALREAQAASSDQAVIREAASSDLAVIRAQQSDAHLIAEAASSDLAVIEAVSDAILEKTREDASSSDKPAHDAASSDAVHGGGPFFFAWSDEGEVFNAIVHARNDDDVFAFDIQQIEGDFASLSLVVRNPRIGLLAPGRKQWAWFSWRDSAGTIWPLYHGRIIGIPSEIQDNVIQMDFLARPSDFAEQKAALAATMRVRPYWDPIWFNDQTRDNPDNVLESRPELWHTDRLSLQVTASNVVSGEDGNLSFTTDEVFFDSVHVSYAQNPLRTVQMRADVSWDQKGDGKLELPRGAGLSLGSTFKSYTGEGLAAAWPKPGQNIGGGWAWDRASVSVKGTVDSSIVGQIVYPNGLFIGPGSGGPTWYADGGFDTSLGVWAVDAGGTVIGWSYHVAIPNVTVTWDLSLAWNVSRRKTEVVSFTLEADVQDIVTMPNDGEVLALTMSSSEVAAAVDPNGVVPLGSQLARGYFNTERGAQSLEYLIAVARAHLLARARAVNVAFEIPFALWVQSGVTMRKNALIFDDRLPGHQAEGKIIGYHLALKDGAPTAGMVIGCSIGKSGTVTASHGAPDYCEIDYVDGEIHSSETPSSLEVDLYYQTYADDFRVPFDSDVAYTSLIGVAPNDDGIDFDHLSPHSVVKAFRLLNGNGDGETQVQALSRFDVKVSDSGQLTATNTRFAQVQIQLPDMTGGPFETDFAPTLSQLKVPKTIDMEAAS